MVGGKIYNICKSVPECTTVKELVALRNEFRHVVLRPRQQHLTITEAKRRYDKG